MGKVTRSAPEFPYILEHISVPMSEPIELDMLTRRINIKEQRKAQVQKVIVEMRRVHCRDFRTVRTGRYLSWFI